MTKRLLPPVVLLLAGAGAWLAGCSGVGGDEPRFNVVLISIDSLVRDRLGVYGGRAEFTETPVSPNIDAFSQEAVAFDEAWATTSWTLPSHMAVFTGLSDRSHAVEMDFFALDPLRRTITQEMAEAGARTAGYYSGPYLDPKYGFGRGFEDYRSAMMTPRQLAAFMEQRNRRRAAEGKPHLTPPEQKLLRDRVSHWDVTSPRVNRMGLRFLDERAGDRKPFFLFLHYFDAHYDYLPDRAEPGLGRKFDPEYRGEFNGANWWFDTRVRSHDAPPGRQRRIGERDLAHVKALYDAEIHWVDRHVGQILRRLRENGMWESTIICITADHGDEFFEHGSIGHRSTLYPEQTRVPLLLRVPGMTEGGSRVDRLVRLYDLAPTLLDYAGAGALGEAEGRTLRPVIDGEETAGRTALGRMLGTLNPRDSWRDQRYTVHRYFESKLSLDAECIPVTPAIDPWTRRHGFEVYDRLEDPFELEPLEPGDPRCQEAVAAFRRAHAAAEAHAKALEQSERALRRAPVYTGEERAMLQELGYTAFDEGDEGDNTAAPEFCPFPAPEPPG